MSGTRSIEAALVHMGESTAESAAGVLRMVVGDGLQVSGTAVVAGEVDPIGEVELPAVEVSVSYVDGVTGGNVFVMSVKSARRLASAMIGSEDPEAPGDELTELELSAIGEAMNQMMAAAAAGTTAVLGTEVEISPPDTRILASREEAGELAHAAPHANQTGFMLWGEPCQLVQLVPSAFVRRMTRALEQQDSQYLGEAVDFEPVDAGEQVPLDGSMRQIPVRVWAELGRSRMSIGRAVGLPGGAIVELDRGVEDPVDLYVNGMRFATGRLIAEGGEWAVRIETVLVGGHPSQFDPEGAVP